MCTVCDWVIFHLYISGVTMLHYTVHQADIPVFTTLAKQGHCTFHTCLFHTTCRSTGFEQKDGNLSQIEIDEMLGLVCNIASEVTSDDAVPCWVEFFVEFLLDKCSNVFFNVVFLQGLSCAIYRVLLHVLWHVGILDYRFTIWHDEAEKYIMLHI